MVKCGTPNIYQMPSNDLRLMNMYAQHLQLAQERGEKPLPTPIALSLGEPHFQTPEHISGAAIKAIQHEEITYGPAAGWPWLKELIAEKIKRVNSYDITVDNTAITMGGTGAIQTALNAILEEGDEVLIPDPGWPQYNAQITCSGGIPVRYSLSPQHGWLPDIGQLESLVNPRTRMLIMNTPANPTGIVFPQNLIADLLNFALRYDLYLLSDECYDEIVFDGKHVSPATFLTPKEFEAGNVLCVYSFSKTYAMTGWRVGYIVASKEIIKTVTHVLDSDYTNISKIVQRAAAAALTGPQAYVDEMLAMYRAHRDLALSILQRTNHYAYTPGGSFYLLIDITPPGGLHAYSRDFAYDLLRERNVLVAPGTSFGQVTSKYVRISLTAPTEDIARGIEEICAFIDR
ncbi:pyridoxal phosphate-dependent aminotransferase [Ktedonosporobacter rubrisoli]|uniref:Aminotransferase n=1 Tax=Ktedonosporobacter rubrisoli TaxID=2509675 RepID=A0A4P6K3Z7_KTERU|nr:pyridoxal phosphate-dependent aminotransferase [Ktedonosporobacter rubrisoli]QBD82894.1 pyridoxal phosphate-dependent aminotransferase [Ktedonosporobacter rubrisoli]